MDLIVEFIKFVGYFEYGVFVEYESTVGAVDDVVFRVHEDVSVVAFWTGGVYMFIVLWIHVRSYSL